MENEPLDRNCPFAIGLLMGALAGAVSLIIIPLTVRILRDALGQGVSEFYSFALSLGVPFVMGAVSGFFWHRAKLSPARYPFYTLGLSMVALVGSVFVLREGVICLIMVSPLLWAVIYLGAYIAQSLLERYRKMSVHLLPLYGLLILGDVLAPQNYQNAVADTVVVKAPPAIVWKYIGEFPVIEAPPRPWIFWLGVPPPVQSRLSEQGLG